MDTEERSVGRSSDYHERAQQLEFDFGRIDSPIRRLGRAHYFSPDHKLREAIAPYLDIRRLRRLVASGDDLYNALRSSEPSSEIRALLQVLTVLLTPKQREKITRPQDIAPLLMLEMSHLDQEELRTVLLDTKGHLLAIETVYRGSLNTAMLRVGEIFKPALRKNALAIIVAHNHPSGDPEPSSEDILVTRQIVDAGQLLDVECVDHLVIGQGRWVSLRERRLGFPV